MAATKGATAGPDVHFLVWDCPERSGATRLEAHLLIIVMCLAHTMVIAIQTGTVLEYVLIENFKLFDLAIYLFM